MSGRINAALNVLSRAICCLNLNTDLDDLGSSALHGQPYADEYSMDGSAHHYLHVAKNHRKLISKLVLAIFKHAMHWAAGEKQVPGGVSATARDAPILKDAGAQVFLESSLKVVCDQTTPVGSASLLEFAR